MREIKFRVFDKDRKEIFYQNYESPTFGKFEGDRHCSLEDVFFYARDDFELMQYTGLKDKNGVDIYEGDLVEAWSEGYKAIGEVKQRIDGYWLMYPAWQSGKSWAISPYKDGTTEVVVVGNIHEKK